MAVSFKNYLLNAVGVCAVSALTLRAPEAAAQTIPLAAPNIQATIDSAQRADDAAMRTLRTTHPSLFNRTRPRSDRFDPIILQNYDKRDAIIGSTAEKEKARMMLDSMINDPNNDCMRELFDRPTPYMDKMIQDYKNNHTMPAIFKDKIPQDTNGGPKGW